MPVRRIPAEEWQTLRAVRLRALSESPDAFASSYEEEIDRPQDWWIDGMTKLAWFVAEVNGEVVGVVAGMPMPDGPEVVSMWVAPDHRGSGVADKMLVAVLAWAKEEGAGGLCLAVAEGNARARRFYERAGFVPTGLRGSLRSRPELCTTEMRMTF